ncbi:MAG TPA: enoyl-CoA hydratase/isomerase family protein [Candidatus Binatia bacterium]|jgi:enoyl-CoA hydratase/carnithine racemase|nr:enoyl-CoA hydratase/isomerase family protein [Candidatus Binatia bacterium]
MPEYKEILYEKKRGGALITLNRPEAMNAISRSMIKEIHQALDEIEQDKEVRAVVLTGAGRAFSAGMDQGTSSGRRRDINWPYGIITGMTAAEVIDSWRVDPRNFRRMWEFGKPIIGAINGWAMGAGSWLSLFTHITLAAENAVFAQPEVRHGSNTNFMWTLLGGYKHALRYGLTGDHIDAQEALRIGLVIKVVPAAELIDECFKIVERIAQVPPETVKINLQVATMGLDVMGLRDALTYDNQMSAPAHLMLREELRRPLDEARANKGIREYLQMRDGPFQPEPFGPRAKERREP